MDIYRKLSITNIGNTYDCMIKNKCTRDQFSKILVVNVPLEEYKRIARVNLCSEKGTKLHKRRRAGVEAIFGLIKGNFIRSEDSS